MTYNSYGVHETSPLPDGYHDEITRKMKRSVYWNEPGLKVIRLRLLSDPGFPMWDVSYCHGLLGDEPVRVRLPFDQLPKHGMQRHLVEHAKADHVYAKGLGILENISTLV